ncbi:polyprenyl synthetase family protein [Paraliobacillus salinarum]|uniref:polyprenyl synthetase family protein n=1 Tax=Paraliobacillus salinarum TaxID=1158996 RepID=UPI0015F4928D|nr:polyprenyl synthetase family protein [Paraliobacillus salinarum]
MNHDQNKTVAKYYKRSEEKAKNYYETLLSNMEKSTYDVNLIKDIKRWKQKHTSIFSASLLFIEKKRLAKQKDEKYLKWLGEKGKLDNYLERSIAYIYMRDLGKDISESQTKQRISKDVEKLKHQIDQGDDSLSCFNVNYVYRWAQKEQIEEAIIWVFEKISMITQYFPKEINAAHAKRKLIKTIVGVVMQVLEDLDDNVSHDVRVKQLDQAVRLGYAYGLTYPFIDDLLDSNLLSIEEKKQFSKMIEAALLTRSVPKINTWPGKNRELMLFVYSELSKAFEYIVSQQNKSSVDKFFEQAYVFFQSQELDRVKQLDNSSYNNKDIYLPIILKSASSRLITRTVLSADEDEDKEERTFLYGIYNQLSDDFSDVFDDLEAGAVTPYTYYLTYKDTRPDLVNPFALYWNVVSYFMYDVNQSDPLVCEIILDRAINGLKRFKRKNGEKQYRKMMKNVALDNKELQRLIEQMVQKANDVDFFDKRIRDNMLETFQVEQEEKENFKVEVKTVREDLNQFLQVSNENQPKQLSESITDAANYTLQGSGKRLRPVMSWMIATKAYNLDKEAIAPLLKSLEYMHTASLIFDDLPAQDNASVRRGRTTVHEVYNQAVGELTGLFLTQRATYEQASLSAFDPEKVLELIRYASEVTANMCKGQAMDLDSKDTKLTLEQLNTMCFYKTGLGFEASLLMPAILVGISDEEKQLLKQFAYHAGVAFQIKDDLLDVEGDSELLGKASGMDQQNKRSTFVSILGVIGAKKKMWDHYCKAQESLDQLPAAYHFLTYLLNYFIERDY